MIQNIAEKTPIQKKENNGHINMLAFLVTAFAEIRITLIASTIADLKKRITQKNTTANKVKTHPAIW
jgi:hypothetical protein